VGLYGDLRIITPADPCPRCGGEIQFSRGIEVGHVFKLGTKYSKTLKAVFLDEQGVEQTIVMGCYGIGVGRTVAAAIEQNHDQDGIRFPIPIAPFEAVILPLQMHEPEVVEAAERIYRDLLDRGLDVLLDDRDLRGGIKFKDADLLGTPVRLTLGLRTVREGRAEMKLRTQSESVFLPLADAPDVAAAKVKELYGSAE
jgi:prolyl-tRNA synthetase